MVQAICVLRVICLVGSQAHMIVVQPACGPTRCCLVASLVRLYGCLWHNLRVICLVGSQAHVHMHGGHVVPTAVAMHMQWGGARGSTFGVHMHVSPPPTKTREKNFLRAKKTFCGSNGPSGLGCLCMWFWCAYACGSNGPNLLVCICMWLQRSQRFWLLMHVAPTALYAQARLVCICRA